MLEPIFKKSDFTLCDVPVPKGYPQSQTHAGIAMHNGFYYLTCSPYPLKKVGRWEAYMHVLLQKISGGRFGKFIDADSFENPLLYIGVSTNGQVPTSFRLIPPAPLIPRPESRTCFQTYNSDPDIFIDQNNIYILNREFGRTLSNDKQIISRTKIHLLQGQLEDLLPSIDSHKIVIDTEECIISPCLCKYNDQYLCAYLDTNSALDSNTFNGLFIKKMNEISTSSFSIEPYKVVVNTDNLLPWHMSLFCYENNLYSIITCVQRGDNSTLWQHLGVFNKDVSQLYIYKTPLTDYSSYRSAACVTDSGEFVLYNTTLNERIKGSRSCDGRDVIMARTGFKQLIYKLKRNENSIKI